VAQGTAADTQTLGLPVILIRAAEGGIVYCPAFNINPIALREGGVMGCS
jgi:hypothetical protein